MKNMRKLFAILLAVVLVMAMAATVSAADVTVSNPTNVTGPGSITLKLPADFTNGATYNIYKVFDANVSVDGNNVSYKLVSGKTTVPAGFNVDTAGNVTYAGTDTVLSETDIENIQAYIKNDSALFTVNIPAGVETYTLENVPYGYYYIDTTLGTLCSVDTTNPTVEVTDKNVVPTITKLVQEDSDQSWDDINDAAIGDIVNFKIEINAYTGAENYVLHDTLGTGLTLKADTIVVEGLTKGTDYTVTTADHSFEIAFSQDYLNKITGTAASPKKITVTYSAELNANAVVGEQGNGNSAVLTYSEKNISTQPATTTTYTWSMQVFKYGDGNVNKPLAGAKFVLFANSTTNGSVAEVVDGKVASWQSLRSLNSESELAAFALTTSESGYITINGLDSDTYYLREIEAPAGYNKLSEDKTVTVRGAGHNTIADINNQSGTELPSTGGMGTTLLYVLGGILVLAAVVLLVMKKRMASAE